VTRSTRRGATDLTHGHVDGLHDAPSVIEGSVKLLISSAKPAKSAEQGDETVARRPLQARLNPWLAVLSSGHGHRLHCTMPAVEGVPATIRLGSGSADQASLIEQVALRRPLERPQAIGFVLMRVWRCRWRVQLRAFSAEMIETATMLATGQRVHVVRPIGDRRHEAFKLGAQPDGRPSGSCSCRGLRLGYKVFALAGECLRTPAHRYSWETLTGEAIRRIPENGRELPGTRLKFPAETVKR
jgi:hypothetical protein